ncbi:MAG: hypothetical protein NZ581_06720 [Candidatus Caldarchaeum sp.]|nr:hypothetical protein [Candidatus Caldarchaeum sp.]MDW8435870.1 hypothetical protein [Candidatus Caldarchaeum sp.]
MLPAITFLTILAFSVVGHYFFTGRRIEWRSVLDPIRLPFIFVFTTVAFEISSAGSYAETLFAILLTASVFTPLTSYIEKRNVSAGRVAYFLRIIFYFLLTAAIIRALQSTTIHPILPISFAIAIALKSRAAIDRIGNVLAAMIILAGLYLSTTIAFETFIPELWPIVMPAFLLALASTKPLILEKSSQAFIPILIGIMVFVFAAIIVSPFADPQFEPDTEFGPQSIILLAVAYASVAVYPPSDDRKGVSKPFDSLLLAAAASLAVAGPTPHQALASLLTPIIGLPAINYSTAVFQNTFQLIGLSAVAELLKRVAQLAEVLLQDVKRKTRIPPQTITVSAIVFALVSASSTSLAPLLTAAGAVNLMILSTVLPSAINNRLVLIPAAVTLLLGFNVAVYGVLSLAENFTSPFDPTYIARITSTAMGLLAGIAGVWVFSSNAVKKMKQ